MKRKKVLLGIGFLLGIAVLLSATEPQFEPKSPRKITIGKENKIRLIDGKKIHFVVYTPKKSSGSVAAAAKEFAALLEQISGQKVPVTRVLPSDPGKAVFRIGDEEFAGKNQLDLASLDRDGFVIKTIGNQILISGNDTRPGDFGTGTLFGVYDFLERFADCRFYFPVFLKIVSIL